MVRSVAYLHLKRVWIRSKSNLPSVGGVGLHMLTLSRSLHSIQVELVRVYINTHVTSPSNIGPSILREHNRSGSQTLETIVVYDDCAAKFVCSEHSL